MSSTMHEEDVNDKLAEKYAELKSKNQNGKAAGVILAAEALGDLGAVSGEIVAEKAEREYMCSHPTEQLELEGSAFICSKCNDRVKDVEVLERLQKED